MQTSKSAAGPSVGPSFKTRRQHKKLRALLPFREERREGYRKEPVLVVLPAETESGEVKPPVRIFLGTEPAQYRAERVFVWSIDQVRDRSRRYEIYLMKDLAGFDRKQWKTGFTLYRYAIPYLAGYQGRAIYNDVDQIYFRDPGEMFDMDMQGAGVMGITEKETSVMLLDCEKLAPHWTREAVQAAVNHKPFRKAAHANKLWGILPAEWNARDHEYVAGESKLLHFTTLHRQPWHPFPKELKYEPHDLAQLWLDMETAADEAGYYIFSKAEPSPRFKELQAMRTNAQSGDTTAQASKELPEVAELLRKTGGESVRDYDLNAEAAPSDGVCAVDLLQRVPEEDVCWVLDDLFGQAARFVYLDVACYPAEESLSDGSNAHATLLPPEWWLAQVQQVARCHPEIVWRLKTREPGILSFAQKSGLGQKGLRTRLFDGKGGSLSD